MKESQHTEWKASWRDDHLRWVCGFANAEGGVLVIGRDDRGEVVGIDDAKRLLEELPNKIRDLLGIVVEVNLREEEGRDYLEIVTDAYPSPISYRGHYHQRSGSTLQELRGAALDRFLLRKQGRTWDGVPVPGVHVADLLPGAFTHFRELAARSGRMDPRALEESDEGLVEKLNLVEGGYLKRAAVLLFHGDPQVFVTGAFAKIGFFRSASDLAYHDEVGGDLFSQVRQTLDLLHTKYLKAAIRYEGLQRIERFPVPGSALREAVLNAVAHRDYAIPAPIQIRVFEDRLSIWNPAVLPEGWSLQKLIGEHASKPFNPLIANAFLRAGEIEAWGRGIQSMFRACEKAGSPQPEFRYEANELWLEFPFGEDYLQLLAGAQQSGDGTETPVETRVKTPVETPVKTPDAIVAHLREQPDLTLADIANRIGKSRSAVERAAAKLVKAGKLRHIGPAKGGHWEVLE